VFLPPEAVSRETDVQLDYVGSLENAAIVISRLHWGEKRLVFVDSRARAEQLGAHLRQLQISAFVTHSSLSQEQRHQAEEVFASRDDCVIVATSVLELGIDVGDLDRVIQIDSPPTVSSFLQRMGEVRLEFPWLQLDSSVAVLAVDGKTEWWTFGGNRANATLARQLAHETATKVRHDSFTLTFDSAVKLHDVQRAIVQLRQQDVTAMRPAIDEAAIDGL
jgi:ERCC4-related helicase